MPGRSWALHLPALPWSCRRARRELQRFLSAQLPEPVVQDAVLVLHELVANGVDHARTPMRLTARVCDGSVRIGVRDGSRVVGHPQPEQEPLDRSGRRCVELVEDAVPDGVDPSGRHLGGDELPAPGARHEVGLDGDGGDVGHVAARVALNERR